jgi:hypothetical protein
MSGKRLMSMSIPEIQFDYGTIAPDIDVKLRAQGAADAGRWRT